MLVFLNLEEDFMEDSMVFLKVLDMVVSVLVIHRQVTVMAEISLIKNFTLTILVDVLINRLLLLVD